MFPEAGRRLGTRTDVRELEHIAFSGRTQLLHSLFWKIPEGEREAFAGRYILHGVIRGGVEKLRAVSSETEIANQVSFLHDIVRLFFLVSRKRGVACRELFEAVLEWSEQLERLSEFDQALHYQEEAIDAGIESYPDLHIRLLLCRASVLNTLGKSRETLALLSTFAGRPYLVVDRNLIPRILQRLSEAALLNEDVGAYKKALFRGLRHFYKNLDDRRYFTERIRKIYRRRWQLLRDPLFNSTDRVLFILHRLHFILHDRPFARAVRLHKLTRLFLLTCVYFLNYFHAGQPRSYDRRTSPKNILVTRATGGIGDFLMMTPAFHQLKKKYPREQIFVAIPRSYFPVLEGNRDVCLVDIHDDRLDCSEFRKWYNFTDCPAARVESRTAPNVKRSRIDIFAQAVGLNWMDLWRMDRRPRYFISEEEKDFGEHYWRSYRLEGCTVIGIQLSSAEIYRDYPYMEQLAKALSRDHTVLLFDSLPISAGFDGTNIIKVEDMPLRHAFGIAARCDAIVAPDSAFVHLAAALDIPCIALFGPIDGEVRTKYYPKCKFLDARSNFACMPCWRNEITPCGLTNMRTSVCMSYVTVNRIVSTLQEMLSTERSRQ